MSALPQMPMAMAHEEWHVQVQAALEDVLSGSWLHCHSIQAFHTHSEFAHFAVLVAYLLAVQPLSRKQCAAS